MERFIKPIPGTIMVTALWIMNINPYLLILTSSIYVLLYILFRKVGTGPREVLMMVLVSASLVLALSNLAHARDFYDALEYLLGASAMLITMRGSRRLGAVSLSVYIIYLLYRGSVVVLPTNLEVASTVLLIFTSSMLIAMSNRLIAYNMDIVNDVLDRVMNYVGSLFTIVIALLLYTQIPQGVYLGLSLVPTASAAIARVGISKVPLALFLVLTILARSVYPHVDLWWVIFSLISAAMVIGQVRVGRPRYIRGLEPPYTWVGAWLNGKYLVEGVIASGGFSYVLKARDEFGRIYAVKVLKDRDSGGNPLASDAKFIATFKREMSEYLRIDSPRIVRVYEVHVPPDEKLPYSSIEDYLEDPPYIVMEYMEGGSLRDMLRERGALDMESLMRIAIEITAAVAELHSMNMVHLDLKPENILFKDPERRIVKIGDLGASRVLVGGRSRVSQFSIAYAAPEVLNGYADFRSDVYSLSCIIYEMATGLNPHLYRLREKVTAIPPISSVRVDFPRELDIVIMAGLDPNPMMRPPSAVEILRILRNIKLS